MALRVHLVQALGQRELHRCFCARLHQVRAETGALAECELTRRRLALKWPAFLRQGDAEKTGGPKV